MIKKKKGVGFVDLNSWNTHVIKGIEQHAREDRNGKANKPQPSEHRETRTTERVCSSLVAGTKDGKQT